MKKQNTIKKIHLIVRTHKREELFRKCLESIARQDYNNRLVHVTADDDVTAKYVKRAVGDGLVDVFYRIDGSMVREPARVFECLLKERLVTHRDKNKAKYNLFLNYVIGKLANGWVFIVDDDKELPHDGILTTIAKELTDNDVMLIGQYVMKSKTVPDGNMWERLPFVRGHIDMSCFVFNVKLKNIAVFDAHKASDWRIANRLAPLVKLKWIKEPFVKADNDGMFGREVSE
jgi:cellulose synthase/poly-beta-1,6-N-acetylglucosamine synthase-like glycosyltransferase